jgi:hypothetical protein
MKKLLIAVLTFLLGVSAVNLLLSKRTETLQTEIVVQRSIEDSKAQTLIAPEQNPKISKSFFDSFSDDQGYSGWLIADKRMKGMKEVWTILLSRNSENSDNSKLVWSAMILTMYADETPNDDDDFHSVWIKTENNHLSFRTNKFRGIEYKFEGDFFKTGKDFSEEEKVLKGTLQKFVRGKQVANFTGDFAYYEPHCFH